MVICIQQQRANTWTVSEACYTWPGFGEWENESKTTELESDKCKDLTTTF